MNEEEGTVSTVKHPYIIKNNNTIDSNIADQMIIEAKVDNAMISIQSEEEALFIPWIDQEWWYLCQQGYLQLFLPIFVH